MKYCFFRDKLVEFFWKTCKGLKGGAASNQNEGENNYLKGFKNRGNDCFVNASGTSLINLEVFQELMKIYPSNTLLKEFQKSQNEDNLISIRPLVKSPDGTLTWVPQDQQDAAEFVFAILDTLSESKEINEDEIKNKFQLKYHKEITCNYPMTQDPIDTEESYFLHVPVKRTLDEAFEKTNKDAEQTHTVGTETFTTKRVYQRSPHVLMIQFTRWMDGNVKNDDPVDIPLTWNPTQIAGPYKLKAAIVHDGALVTSGHYYALITKNGKFYCVNDDKTSELTYGQFLQNLKRSYVLFFEKSSQDSFDDNALSVDDIRATNKTPPSSPTAHSALKRKLMDTNEVKKNRKKDSPCQFCNSEQDRTTLMTHLQSNEVFCR